MKSTSQSELQNLLDIIDQQFRPLPRWWAPTPAGLSKASAREISLVARAARSLAALPDQSEYANNELYWMLKQLHDMFAGSGSIAAELRVGLNASVITEDSENQLSELYAQPLAKYKSAVVSKRKVASLDKTRRDEICALVWPDDVDSIDHDHRWAATLARYRQKLLWMRKDLISLCRRSAAEGGMLSQWLIGSDVPQLPNRGKKALFDLYSWHETCVRRVYEAIALGEFEPRWENGAHQILVIPKDRDLELRPFLRLTYRRVGPNRQTDELLYPDIWARLSGTPVARGLASGDVDRLKKKLTQVAGTGGEVQKLVSRLGQTGREYFSPAVVSVRSFLEGHTHKIPREPAVLLTELLGRQGFAGQRHHYRLASIDPEGFARTQTAVGQMRTKLQNESKIRFDDRGDFEIDFAPDDRPDSVGLCEGLWVDGQGVVPPKYEVGGRPLELLSCLERIPREMNGEAVRRLISAINNAAIWYDVRTKNETSTLQDLVVAVIQNGDAVSATLAGSLDETWEIWLSEFRGHVDRQVGRVVLEVESRPGSHGANVNWDWKGGEYRSYVQRQRGITWCGKGVQETAVVLSHGLKSRPRLLCEFGIDPTHDRTTDYRHPERRHQLGVRLLCWLGAGHPLDADVKELLALIGGRLYPEVGEPLQARIRGHVEWEFDMRPQNTVLAILAFTVVFEDVPVCEGGQAVPFRARVSRGDRPGLMKALGSFVSEDRLHEATRDYRPGDDSTVGPLISVALEVVNRWVGLDESEKRARFAAIKNVEAELAGIGATLLPWVQTDDGYDKTRFTELVKSVRIASFSHVLQPPTFDYHPTVYKGHMISVRNHVCKFGEQILGGTVSWVESLGPRSKEQEVAEPVVELLEQENLYDVLGSERHTRHRETMATLERLVRQCVDGHPRELAEAAELLVRLLADLDELDDVCPPHARSVFDLRRRSLLEFLIQERGYKIEPDRPVSNSSAPPDTERILVAGNREQIVLVLARRVTAPGASSSGRALCGVGTEAVDPARNTEWTQIDALYRVLRAQYPGSIMRFTDFFEKRNQYLMEPASLKLTRIVAAAERLGIVRMAQPDPKVLRDAIDAIEETIRAQLGLRRIGVRTGSAFREDSEFAYRVKKVAASGKRRDTILRILEPAYRDERDGSIPIKGTLLLAE